jgi:antitoxin VapB
MGLYIKDDAVDRMAIELQSLLGTKTKTEAVRTVLAESIAKLKPKAKRKPNLYVEIAKLQAMVEKKLGPSDHTVDMKAFMDELSGENDY